MIHSLKTALVALVVLCATFIVAGCKANAYPSATAPKPFYMGVYIYEYQMERVAAEQKEDYFVFLERHLKILQQNGVNTIYLGGAGRDRFGEELALFAKYGMSVVPQLDFAYYQPTWNDEQMASYAKTAADFINKYADNPNVLAFSVREEVPQNAINGLARYYAAILAQAPKARFQLINSNLGAATDIPVPDPVIMGTDRYAFWFEISGGGYLATPGFSLNWVRSQADSYYQQAARRGADFSLVITQGGLMMPSLADSYAGDGEISYPKTKVEQDKLRERVRTFAADGRMGWGEFDTPQGKRYNVWKYYRLPKNAMKALAWTAVLEGAKSFYVWSYLPPSKDTLETTFKSAALAEKPKAGIDWMTLAGRPDMPNPQLNGFAEASREIRAYQNVITQMSRTNETLVKSEQKGIFHNAFMLPKFKGRVVVLQNSNIGTWPGNSAGSFKDSDDVRIDDDGNLVGYKGFDKPMDVNFSLTNQQEKLGIFDLKTGKQLQPQQATFTIPILPGGGALLFIGTKSEADELHQMVEK